MGDCVAPKSCEVSEDTEDGEEEDVEEVGSVTEVDNGEITQPLVGDHEEIEDTCLKDLRIPHYNEGCLQKLNESFHKYINIVGAVMVSVWVIVLLNVLFSFALCVVLDYAEYTYR